MEKIGVADYGIYAWSGGFYDYGERIARVGAIGFDGLERLYPTSAEDALQKASNLKKMKMGFATCNAENPELAIRWTAALGGTYVWAEVAGGDFDSYVRQVREMTRVANRYGIDVAVHNHLGQTVESQEEIEAFLRECPETKLLFDVGHLAVAGGRRGIRCRHLLRQNRCLPSEGLANERHARCRGMVAAGLLLRSRAGRHPHEQRIRLQKRREKRLQRVGIYRAGHAPERPLS